MMRAVTLIAAAACMASCSSSTPDASTQLATEAVVTPAVPLPDVGAHAEEKARWSSHNFVDAISDVKTFTISLTSIDSRASLSVGCSNAIFSIDIYAPEVWSKYGDEAYVSYRFDEKPGVVGDKWSGGDKIVSVGYQDTPAFFAQLQNSKKLLVRLPELDGFMTATFDLAGIEVALPSLPKECRAGVADRLAKRS